jgi:uncharacterized surface protein with fasciclin (FAS1) repeats
MIAFRSLFAVIAAGSIVGCSGNDDSQRTTDQAEAPAGAGQSGVVDDVSQKDVVKVAVGSKDHTTLVTAIKAAELVDALSNAGPFTVFAPTNAAFGALPPGTVEDLVKPENKNKLSDILYHHVALSAQEDEALRGKTQLQMFDGAMLPLEVKDGALYIDGAKVLASIRASNGVVHVVDKVLLPK